MGKITFRADDELVSQLESYDASKSEVMRTALRAFLDSPAHSERSTATEGIQFRDENAANTRTKGFDGNSTGTEEELPRETLERETVHSVEKISAESVEGHQSKTTNAATYGSIDEYIRTRVNELIELRIDEMTQSDGTIAVSVSSVDDQPVIDTAISGVDTSGSIDSDSETKPSTILSDEIAQYSASELLPFRSTVRYVPTDAVGTSSDGEEHSSDRETCDCGVSLRSNWSFCPGCGRQQSASDISDSN